MRYLLAGILLIYSLAGQVAAATSVDAISYEYRAIDARYEILPDSSIKVEERITITYEGTYHSLWRGIGLGAVAVSDVEVLDGDTGSSLRLTARFPEDPNAKENYGTYAWINDDGYFKVQWYYDAADTTKTWVLRYTLRGAVGFMQEHDEFVWSLFSRYAVPVASSTVDVVLPADAQIEGELVGTQGSVMRPDQRTLRLEAQDIQPGGGVSFAARWPKGVVHPPVRGFFIANLVLKHGVATVAAATVLLLAALGGIAYTLYRRRGR